MTAGSAPGSPLRPALAERRLYLCTPDRPDLAGFLESCLRGGVDLVQLRDKDLDARAVVARGRVALDVCRAHGVPFIINDRPDLAVDVGADGVHVGQDDATAALARRLLGGDAMIGLSTHDPQQLDASVREPVDYVSAGPVQATPTKAGRTPTGVGYVTYAAAHAARPVFVTGGVAPDNVAELARAGARGFVVVRFLTGSADPQGDARRLRGAIDDAVRRAQDA